MRIRISISKTTAALANNYDLDPAAIQREIERQKHENKRARRMIGRKAWKREV